MHLELEEYSRQISSALPEIRELVASLSREQILWRPAPNSWSVAECLVHLNLTSSLYQRTLQAAIEGSRARGVTGSGPFQYGWVSRWMVRQTEPSSKRRFPASKKIIPPREIDVTALWPESQRVRQALIGQLAESDGLDLAKVKFRSPLMPLLRMELGQGFAILCAHDRRHLLQAKRVLEAPGFPR